MTGARCVLLLTLASLALGVAAQEPWPVAGAQVAGQRDARGWPVVPNLSRVGRGERVPAPAEVAVVLPEGDETPAQTLARAGALAARYTRESGFEACALVCKTSQGQAALRLTTNFSQVGCLTKRLPASCPAGTTMTGETLHSHPQAESVVLNPVDAVFASQRRGRRVQLEPERFSDRDLANGPGYLATGGHLLHQDGPDRGATVVGPLLHGVPATPVD